jgi:sarcosine oxidase subunit gamma
MTDISKGDQGHINLRGDATDSRFVDNVANVLGQSLPLTANKLTQSRHRVYWLGPDEWQIVTEFVRVADLMQQLEDALAGQHVAINDLSGGQVSLHLSGTGVPELLARACTLDLHPLMFGVGDCAQSGLAKASVLLGCIGDAPAYEIIVRRSFSEYLLRWLRQNTHSRAGSASS